MIVVACSDEGSVIPLHVQPGARKNEIVGERNGSLLVSVTAAPDKGQANQAVERLLAKALGLAKSRVAIIAGSKSRHKKVLFHDVSAEVMGELLELLQVRH